MSNADEFGRSVDDHAYRLATLEWNVRTCIGTGRNEELRPELAFEASQEFHTLICTLISGIESDGSPEMLQAAQGAMWDRIKDDSYRYRIWYEAVITAALRPPTAKHLVLPANRSPLELPFDVSALQESDLCDVDSFAKKVAIGLTSLHPEFRAAFMQSIEFTIRQFEITKIPGMYLLWDGIFLSLFAKIIVFGTSFSGNCSGP